MSDKNWIELRATGPRANKDAAALVLVEAGSPGVIEEEKTCPRVGKLEAYSNWDGELPSFEESNSSSPVLVAYLRPSRGAALEGLKENLSRLGWSFTTGAYKDQDWSVKWKARLKPVKVTYKGRSVIVKPTWKKARRKRGDVVIDIDPGMAFGTGGHATTRMCLKAIVSLVLGKGVKGGLLDVGTGTGVLAIAAKKLGVKKAVGAEIDPVAVKVARKNARLNNAAVTVTGSPLEKLKQRFPIVVANILAGDLIRMSADLKKKTGDGGYLVLSGILGQERQRVKEAFTSIGFKPYKDYSSKEWAAIILRKETR